jgi:peptide chain release factor subunit 1
MPEAQTATKMSSMDKYRFRRALEEIEKAQGRGTELVSVYVPPDRPIFEVTNYLRGEYSQSSNIKSASTRKHVMQAIESIINRLKQWKMPPPNGLVCFVGHKDVGADQTQMVAYVLEPPEPVPSFLYRCDSRFYTEPLHEMLAEKDVYGLLVIDQGEATIGLLEGKRITPLKNVQSLVPRKHRMGGQSARRFERLHEQAVHEFFTKIGDLATEAFLNRRDLKGLLIAGPGYTKDAFVKEGYLHHELAKKVLGTFDAGYTDETGLRELVANAADVLRDLDLMREKSLVQRLMDEIRKEDGGLAAYGEDVVRRALGLGAVDTLLVSEGLRKIRLDLRCPNCGHTETKTVADETTLPKCPNCGKDRVVESRTDIVDELSALADRTSAKVELISADSEEGGLLLKAFAGIAAILRYRVA